MEVDEVYLQLEMKVPRKTPYPTWRIHCNNYNIETEEWKKKFSKTNVWKRMQEKNSLCGSKNYPYLLHGRDFSLNPPPLWKFQSSFIHLLKSLGLWEPPSPQEFPIPSVGGVWIFSGTTHYKNNTPKTMPLLKKHSCLIILMPNTVAVTHEHNEILAPLKCHWLQRKTCSFLLTPFNSI